MKKVSDKKSIRHMLIYLLLLAAVIAVGCFTDLFDFKELGAVFTVNMTSLLKLVIMVLVILLAVMLFSGPITRLHVRLWDNIWTFASAALVVLVVWAFGAFRPQKF